MPVNKPLKVKLEKYGPPSQVRVLWTPLSPVEARGTIILYKLQWRSVAGEFSNVRYIDGESDEFVITGTYVTRAQQDNKLEIKSCTLLG